MMKNEQMRCVQCDVLHRWHQMALYARAFKRHVINTILHRLSLPEQTAKNPKPGSRGQAFCTAASSPSAFYRSELMHISSMMVFVPFIPCSCLFP